MIDRIKSFAKKVVQDAGKLAVAGLTACGLAVSAVPSQAAATLDFTGVSTAITAELSPAITAAMPIAGIILAAGIAWKLYKRFTK